MTKKENQALLRSIAKGIKLFPKVLALKKRAYKEQQKRVLAFSNISKSLRKQLDDKEAKENLTRIKSQRQK